MYLPSVVLILTIALTPLSNAATTYNLALLQETLEVIGEDIVMFITNKLNGGGNTADDDESLFDTADEQPEGLEDDEEEENSSEEKENATSESETEKNEEGNGGKGVGENQHEGKIAEKGHQVGSVAVSKLKPKTDGKKKYVTVINQSKEPSTKTKDDLDAKKVKEDLKETDDEDDIGKNTEETQENDDEEEEEEPDMAEALASVAVNVAAQKFKEQLGRLNIQLK